MKFSDIIKNILNRITIKKLPAPSLIETEIIPISYKGRIQEREAAIIKEEIQRYPDLYKAFLEEYDGISIGNSKNEFNNPLRIVHGTYLDLVSTFFLTKKFTTVDAFDTAIANKYVNKSTGKAFSHKLILNDIKQKYIDDNKLENYKEKRDNYKKLYKNIINKEKCSYVDYEKILCNVKDWKGLKMLWDVNCNSNKFAEEYLDKNLFTILNNTIDLYSDKSCNNFFDKNLDLIFHSTRLAKLNRYLNDKLTSQYTKRVLKNSKDINLSTCKFYINNKDNVKVDNNKIIELTEEVLNHIDSTGKLASFFNEKNKDNKIILYNVDEKDKEIKRISKEHYNDRKMIKSCINLEECCYDIKKDLCFVPILNRVTDVPAVVHEFIHQYYYNNGKVDDYSAEIPSVYFEKVAIDYLCKNGFEQSKDTLNWFFTSRKIEETVWSELSVAARFIEISRLKKDVGKISLKNIMDDEYAEKAYSYEKNFCEDIKTVDDTKKRFAKTIIKTLSNKGDKMRKTFKTDCSYSLGTLLADKFGNEEVIKKRMLKLINEPEYLVQNILDCIGIAKVVDINIDMNKDINKDVDNKLNKEDEKER